MGKTETINFADWLRRRLEDGGLTHDTFSASIGVTAQAVSLWVRGVHTPTGRARSAIARELGVTRELIDKLIEADD